MRINLMLILIALACAGCDGGASADTVVYRSPGKQTAPVTLDTMGTYQARVGEAFQVPLRLTTNAPAASVRIEVGAADGLMISERVLEYRYGRQPAGSLTMPDLAVTAITEGRHAILITVFMELPDGARFRSFSIPVEVGEPKRAVAANKASIEVDARGERVHVLPATETR